jgi:hypothetical protein
VEEILTLLQLVVVRHLISGKIVYGKLDGVFNDDPRTDESNDFNNFITSVNFCGDPSRRFRLLTANNLLSVVLTSISTKHLFETDVNPAHAVFDHELVTYLYR